MPALLLVPDDYPGLQLMRSLNQWVNIWRVWSLLWKGLSEAVRLRVCKVAAEEQRSAGTLLRPCALPEEHSRPATQPDVNVSAKDPDSAVRLQISMACCFQSRG